MNYTASRGEKGKVDVKAVVPAKDFDARYKVILEDFVKTTEISGYRRGKAPSELVEGRVGANKILNEAANYFVGVKLSEIFKKEDFSPIDSPKLSIDSLERGKDFAFSASFTLKPKVQLGAWKKIKIKKTEAKKVTAADVNESVANIFNAWKKSKEKTENKKQETGESKTKESSGEKSEEDKKFIYDARGEKIFVEDKDEEKKEVVDFKEPGDDWAKAVGAQDMKHLRELVTRDLEAMVASQVETKLEQELFVELRKIGKVEVPEILVEDELNRILVRVAQDLEAQGKELSAYLAEQKTTVDELKAKWREQAENNVETSLVLQQIGADEKVQVTPEEMQTAMKNVGEQKLDEKQKRDLENYVTYNIFTAKTLDLIKKAISS